MDVTGAAVVLIFLYAIFSGWGGKMPEGQYPPANFGSSVEIVANIPVSYTAVSDSNLQDSISRFTVLRAKKLSRDQIDQVVASILKYGQQYDVNPKLVAAMIDRESGFNPEAVSSSNAQGFAQLLPSTAAHIGIRNPFDPDEGVKGASLYLKMMMDRWIGYPNQATLALASYAEGPNQISRSGGKFTDATAKYIRDIYTKYASIN